MSLNDHADATRYRIDDTATADPSSQQRVAGHLPPGADADPSQREEFMASVQKQLEETQRRLATSEERSAQALQLLAQMQAGSASPKQSDDVSPEMRERVMNAMRDGDENAPALLDDYLDQRFRRYADQHIQPSLRAGVDALAQLDRRTAQPKYGEMLEPFKDEVERVYNEFGEQRMQPGAYEVAQQIVAGRHVEQLLKRQEESIYRRLRESPTSIPGLKPERDTPQTPTAMDLMKQGFLTRAQVSSIQEMGGEETFAQTVSRGKKDWSAYVNRLTHGQAAAPGA